MPQTACRCYLVLLEMNRRVQPPGLGALCCALIKAVAEKNDCVFNCVPSSPQKGDL